MSFLQLHLQRKAESADWLSRQLLNRAEYVAENYSDSVQGIDEANQLEQAGWAEHDNYCHWSVRAMRLGQTEKAQASLLIYRADFLTLAQVSALFHSAKKRNHEPPAPLERSNILATCHASNAPGLIPNAMNYWQVPARE
jgi:hypothetical protein